MNKKGRNRLINTVQTGGCRRGLGRETGKWVKRSRRYSIGHVVNDTVRYGDRQQLHWCEYSVTNRLAKSLYCIFETNVTNTVYQYFIHNT